jgi:hypothetical protein
MESEEKAFLLFRGKRQEVKVGNAESVRLPNAYHLPCPCYRQSVNDHPTAAGRLPLSVGDLCRQQKGTGVTKGEANEGEGMSGRPSSLDTLLMPLDCPKTQVRRPPPATHPSLWGKAQASRSVGRQNPWRCQESVVGIARNNPNGRFWDGAALSVHHPKDNFAGIQGASETQQAHRQ